MKFVLFSFFILLVCIIVPLILRSNTPTNKETVQQKAERPIERNITIKEQNIIEQNVSDSKSINNSNKNMINSKVNQEEIAKRIILSDITKDCALLFNKHDIDYYVDCGTLLGYLREGMPILG